MKISICGSMQFEQEMSRAAEQLQELGYDTEQPSGAEDRVYADEQDLDKKARLKQGFVKEHFAKIDRSEGILVVNNEKKGIPGYIGGSTLMEMTYAFSQGLDIYTLYSPPVDISYAQEINAMMPIELGGDIRNLDNHVQELPTVYISSESPIKHSAIGRGFRKAGLPCRTIGVKVESDVNEQPQTIEETYEGALNRHKALKATLDSKAADYYATIESGLHPIHKDHNVFGNTVIVIEKNGDNPKIGIDVDIEIPRSLTDKVPSVYPDIGALVQQEFGSDLKDPYPFITGNQLTRAKIIEEAVFRVAVQSMAQDKDQG